jgi:hypothetical protein
MKSITVHKLDDVIVEGIEARAKAKGQSLNVTIKELLAQALNVDTDVHSFHVNRRGYRRFLGKWSEADVVEFEKATADFEKIDNRDWE